MPRQPRICPACTAPVRQRDSWRSVGGVRYHLDCAAPRGRPTTGRGAGSRQVVVRLTNEESSQIDVDAAATGASAAELLRRAYFR